MKIFIKSFGLFIILISVFANITCKKDDSDYSSDSKLIRGDIEKFTELARKHNALILPASAEKYSFDIQTSALKNRIVIDTVISSLGYENGKYILSASLRSPYSPSVFAKLSCDEETYEQIMNFKSRTAYVAADLKCIDKLFSMEEAANIDNELICFNSGDKILLTGEIADIVEYN